MAIPMPNSGHRTYYTIAEAAWLLGVPRSTVNKAIRIGELPTVWRRSRLVVPAHVVKRLLDEPAGGELA